MKKYEIFKRFIFVPVGCFVILFLMATYVVLDEIGFLEEEPSEALLLSTEADTESRQDALNNIKTPEKVKPGTKVIDINTASAEDFMRLPGIGKAKAWEIVRQRVKMHGFYSVDDLACTDGIGTKTIEKLREFVTISEYKGEQ